MTDDQNQQDRRGAQTDWSRPIPIGRFAVLLEPAPTDRFDHLTSLGHLVWGNGTDVDPNAQLPGWPARVTPALTEAFAARDEGNLYLRVVCQEPHMDRIRSGAADLWANDNVSISLDPLNDHWRTFRVTILPDGRAEGVWQTLHTGYIPADLSPRPESSPVPAKARVQQLADRWVADLTVAWRDLEMASPGRGYCLGLNVCRWRTVGCEQLYQWSPTYGLVHDARLFGDLYIGPPAAVLQQVRLGGPSWGPNRGYARFVAGKPFRAWIEAGESVEPSDTQPARLVANEYGLVRYILDYRIDPRDVMEGRLTFKWSGDADDPAAADVPVSSASFVFGWKRSMLLTHVAGRSERPERPTDAAAPEFFAAMCDYLLAQLPRFSREGGRYLVSEDGLRIDLLGFDPLAPIAQSVVERIQGDEDQLAACALVLCQPEVLISSGAWARASAIANPAGVLWQRGTFCDIYSLILCELIERVAALRNETVQTGLVVMPRPAASPLPWPNHWWAGVWRDGAVTILDAELGRFFYRRDGRTLATLGDLFDDPSLAEAAGIGMGDYFRMCARSDVAIRHRGPWREIRPL